MSDLSFFSSSIHHFQIAHLTHCINNELADRYFHVCYLSWVIYDISVFGIVYIKT